MTLGFIPRSVARWAAKLSRAPGRPSAACRRTAVESGLETAGRINAEQYPMDRRHHSRVTQALDEGHSTAEIGRCLRISKNAVVGKAHRLNLTTRKSPIKMNPQRQDCRPSPPRSPR